MPFNLVLLHINNEQMTLKNIESSKLINNITKRRLELHVQNKIIYLEYIIDKQKLILVNTYFPPSLDIIEDFGLILIKKVDDFTKNKNLTLSATCPYFNGLLNNKVY